MSSETGRSAGPSSGLDSFIHRAARHRLLTAEEEADLGKRLAAGREARAMLAARSLSPLQRLQLEHIRLLGDRAAHSLISHNFKLVFNLAARFHSTAAGADYTLEDRIQEGHIGLLRAVARFDPGRGYKFSTYAVWWIRQSLQRGAQRTGMIQLPAYVWEDIEKVRSARNKLLQAGGIPNERSLSQVSGLGRTAVRRVLALEPQLRVHPLDSPRIEDGLTLAALLPDKAPSPAARAIEWDTSRVLWRRLNELAERDRFVIERRFGLADGREWSLEELSQVLGVTRERVRQLQNKALKSLADDEGLAALR